MSDAGEVLPGDGEAPERENRELRRANEIPKAWCRTPGRAPAGTTASTESVARIWPACGVRSATRGLDPLYGGHRRPDPASRAMDPR